MGKVSVGTGASAAHPANAGLRTIETKRGRRLLVDGWWGVARHINYFGDWLMACVLPTLLAGWGVALCTH